MGWDAINDEYCVALYHCAALHKALDTVTNIKCTIILFCNEVNS